jgi:hypothetical protein
MSKHDTWIKLKPDYLSHLTAISISEFPDGLPARDPFPMAGNREWVLDLSRLDGLQYHNLVMAIAYANDFTPEVADKQLSSGAFTIPDEWVSGASYGAEGMRRIVELATRFESAPTPEEWEAFIADQIARWVDGNEVVPVSSKHMVGGYNLI